MKNYIYFILLILTFNCKAQSEFSQIDKLLHFVDSEGYVLQSMHQYVSGPLLLSGQIDSMYSFYILKGDTSSISKTIFKNNMKSRFYEDNNIKQKYWNYSYDDLANITLEVSPQYDSTIYYYHKNGDFKQVLYSNGSHRTLVTNEFIDTFYFKYNGISIIEKVHVFDNNKNLIKKTLFDIRNENNYTEFLTKWENGHRIAEHEIRYQNKEVIYNKERIFSRDDKHLKNKEIYINHLTGKRIVIEIRYQVTYNKKGQTVIKRFWNEIPTIYTFDYIGNWIKKESSGVTKVEYRSIFYSKK